MAHRRRTTSTTSAPAACRSSATSCSPRFPTSKNVWYGRTKVRVPVYPPAHGHPDTEGERALADRGRRSGHASAATSSATTSSCAGRSSAAASASAAACTVIVNGQAVRSCVTPVSAVAERRDHDARRTRHARETASDSAGVHRRAGRAVRLLPERRDPDRQGVPRPEPARHRRADSAGAVRRAVPLLRATCGCSGRFGATRREATV